MAAESAKLPAGWPANSGSTTRGSAVGGVQVRLKRPMADRISGPWRPAVRKLSTTGKVMADAAEPTSAAAQSAARLPGISNGTSAAAVQISSAADRTCRGARPWASRPALRAATA